MRRFPSLLLAPAVLLAGCHDRDLPTALPTARPHLDALSSSCVVTSTADDGEGSLRAAIANTACSTITFDVTGTITLTSGTLVIDRDVSIIGPGADKLTVMRSKASGTPGFRIFRIPGVDGVTRTVSISGLTITNGQAPTYAAGIHIGSTLSGRVNTTLDGLHIWGNSGESGGGIGIYSPGLTTVIRSTIRNNVSGIGGGISNFFGGNLTVINSTVSGNSAPTEGPGIEHLGGTLRLINSTIANNDGAGIVNDGLLIMRNSIIANNDCVNEPFYGGRVIDEGYNLVQNGHCISAETSRSGDPLLGPLAYNGGPTPTFALLEGSPAIDAIPFGANGCGSDPTTDQRGELRPQGGNCDIGAFEVSRDATPPVIQASVQGLEAMNGWYIRDPVTVSWTVTDGESTIFSQDGCTETVIDYETAGVTLTCTATSGGGTASKSVTIKRDATSPTLAPVVSPNPVLLGGTATVEPNPTDALAGVANATCHDVDASSVGAKSLTCGGMDRAGNVVTTTVPYNVVYGFGGFAAPLSSDPTTVNVTKAGKNIPLKWRLVDASGNGVTTLESVKVTVTSVACEVGESAEEITEDASGPSGLQNLGNGNYQYNWKTPKSYANTCWVLHLDLGDGSSHPAVFQFTR